MRQRDDAHVEAHGDGELHPPQRRRLSRGVAVEAEPHAPRQAREVAELRVGQRRPHRRDDRLEAGLPEREHVGVPLDDDGAVLLRDRAARAVEPVEERALAEELALGGVLVLRLILGGELARLEAEDAAARVGDREDDPPLEVVAAAACEPGSL
jgi:hypothetical protein